MATKFETIGVQYQQESLTKEEALKNFQWSCRCCCNRGMKLDCDRCAINHVHVQTLAILDDIAKMKANKGKPVVEATLKGRRQRT